MSEWRTRADPEWTADYGVSELHVVMFEPREDRPGKRDVVAVQIPETPRQQIRAALRQADTLRARLLFVCDTQKQADETAKAAAKQLPTHRRVAYERAAFGGWGLRHG
jgi:K+-sensing histidine kinase KdpD